jgi:hypothetical protein
MKRMSSARTRDKRNSQSIEELLLRSHRARQLRSNTFATPRAIDTPRLLIESTFCRLRALPFFSHIMDEHQGMLLRQEPISHSLETPTSVSGAS